MGIGIEGGGWSIQWGERDGRFIGYGGGVQLSKKDKKVYGKWSRGGYGGGVYEGLWGMGWRGMRGGRVYGGLWK